MNLSERRFFAPRAWTGGGWADDVLLVADARGYWTDVQTGVAANARHRAEVLRGPVLPGIVNGHSHAFQRAIAGLTERSAQQRDDFWSWRDRMYAVAMRITPPQLEEIASFLYAELLRGGYTHVCEFHYLHNDVDGSPYADPLEMSLALVRAAQRTGIGLTLLPTLYMRSGFGATGLRDDQRRFASTPDSVLRIAQAVRHLSGANPLITAGIAIHSLRAVDEGALREAAQEADAASMPVHIHVAEQVREVEDCVEHHGQRPIERLLSGVAVNESWNLVHATQANAGELQAVARAGAAIVLCPSTEANLGDGVFDLPAWLGASGRWSIGSDSHVTRSWIEELRLLEYSQRFVLQRRNAAALAAQRESTAAVLLEGALDGGSIASGQSLGGFAVGRRADFVVLDPEAPSLAGIAQAHTLDAALFSSPAPRFTHVVAGGRDVPLAMPATQFRGAMRALWHDTMG